MRRFPRSLEWPHWFWLAHKCYRHLGRCSEGLAHWDEHIARLRAQGAGETVLIDGEPYRVPPEYRIDARSYADRYGYYRGFFLYALGRLDEAGKALREYSDGLHERIRAGKEIGPDTKVYLEFMADPLERRLALLGGLPAPPLGDTMTWITPPTEEPGVRTCRLRLFCNVDSARTRHADLMLALDRLGKEFWPRGLRIEWIIPAISPRVHDGVVATAAEIVRRNELAWTVGVDQGGSEAPVHLAHQVLSGTVTIIQSDADGKVAWELIDPMHWDEGLIRSVIERLLPPADGGK
jgi:hypothetical protein